MSATYMNLSDWPDAMLRKSVEAGWRDGIEEATVIFSDVWFDHERHLFGETELPIDESIGWDAICYYEERVAYVFLRHDTLFPLVWWVNPVLKGSYQRGMVFFSAMEYFVYSTAHELAHIWQFDNPRKRRFGHGMEGADDEMDADLHAITALNAYRRKTRFKDYENASSF